MNVDAVLDDVIGNEGGFVDDPDDAGGATQYGVSLRFAKGLPKVNGRSPMDLNGDGVVDVQDIHLVTKTIAKKLFLEYFYYAPQIDKLPACIQPVLLDDAVNAGGGGAIKALQLTLVQNGLVCKIDGSLGPETLRLTEKLHDRLGDAQLTNAVVRGRIAYYQRIVAANPGNAKFLNGWTARANRFRVAA